MDKFVMLLRKENELELENMHSKNFDIEIFSDVILGLQAIKKLKPKLIVIDLATSKISGIEILRIIRSNPANYHTKIIVTAKNFNMSVIERAFNLGADYFIKYPFKINDLEKIYELLRQFNDFTNLEAIASKYDYDWAIGIWDSSHIFFDKM